LSLRNTLNLLIDKFGIILYGKKNLLTHLF